MPTQATRIVKNCQTGEEIIETYEIPDPMPEEVAAQALAAQQQMIKELTSALEAHYDSVAQTRRYDNRLTCALRAGYAGPFQSEGATFAIWMDTCNAAAYVIMAECLAGTRAIPTPAEIVAAMPEIVWP